jgi:hypothetical protein
MTRDLKTPMPPPASGPTASGRRFLAQLMEHAFREGWRTPDDFVKHFPANVIMTALRSAPDLRVAILAAATGIYEAILRRKTPVLAAEDLRIALDEGTTTSQVLLSVFSPEDRVRYLDPQQIWDFLAEDRFWELDADASEELRQSAMDRMAFTLTQALQERLISLRDVMDALTYDAVADSLSPHELRSVVRHALVKGRDGIVLNEKVLLEVLPLDKLVRSVPLDRIWNEVVIRRLAVPCGLTELTREERRVSQAEKRAPERRRGPSRPPALPNTAGPGPSGAASAPLPGATLSGGMMAAAGPPSPGAAGGRVPSDYAVTAPPPSAARDLSDPSAYSQGYPESGYSEAGYSSGNYAQASAGVAEYRIDEDAEDDVMTAVPPPVGVAQRDGSLLPPPGASPALEPEADEFGPPLREQPLMTLPQPPMSSRQAVIAASLESQPSDTGERQRQRVTEHLRAIGRLPPRHAIMPAAVLRSIDAMYALLPSATDDIQRKSVIRQAFANENYLRVALLGLIELMDSSVDTTDPVIQEAKIEALIKILLFEEQRRKETGRFPSGTFNASRGLSSSVPPYYPQSSAPPSSLNPLSAPPSSGTLGYVSSASLGGPPHVPTQRPPPPVLNSVPGYPGAAAPLPNLPAEPASSRRRTVPPPLPPSYPRE